ncbi:hypothetical protein [Pandoravirus japonicus]|uniref:Uncharacterized protein n=1 Tax=Pandoravirus japonicus TaxID=2823154 RepID=A0A811BLZ5_9VIRU|nr:hypothetical protein [Pandoravirus japonicus]
MVPSRRGVGHLLFLDFSTRCTLLSRSLVAQEKKAPACDIEELCRRLFFFSCLAAWRRATAARKPQAAGSRPCGN